MKRSEVFFSTAQVPLDFIMILLAATTAYFLRSLPAFEGYVSKVFNLSFPDYIKPLEKVARYRPPTRYSIACALPDVFGLSFIRWVRLQVLALSF